MGSSSCEETVKYVEILIQKKNQERLGIVEEIEQRKFDRHEILLQLNGPWWTRNYGSHNNYYVHKNHNRYSVPYTRNDLDEHNDVDHKELVIKIRGLVHRLQNGRNSLVQEKQMLKEIKCAEEQREKHCVQVEENNWEPWRLPEIVKSKKSSKDMQLEFNEMKGLWKEQKAYDLKVSRLKKELKVVEEEINSLRKKLESINVEKGKLYNYILELKR